MLRNLIALLFALGFICSAFAQEAKMKDKPPKTIENNPFPYYNTTFRFGPLQKGPGVVVSTIFNYQKSQYLGYGGGLDYSLYNFDAPYSFLTPFGSYRALIRTGRKTGYFLEGKIGYGLPVSTIDIGVLMSRGGIFSEVGGGIRFGNKPPIFDLAISWRIQKANFNYEVNGQELIESSLFKRVGIQMGLSF